jgi:hypothetical protein
MKAAIPFCLSPLFVGTNPKDVRPLGEMKSTDSYSEHRDRREAISTYYGAVHGSALQNFEIFFRTYVPKNLPNLKDQYDGDALDMLKGLRAFVIHSIQDFYSGRGHRGRSPHFDNPGMFQVSDGLRHVESIFETIRPLEVKQHKDPSLMGSPSFETRSELRDLLKTCVFGSAVLEKAVYTVVRKLVTSVFGGDIVFYYLFVASEAARARIVKDSNLFVMLFADQRSDPISVFFDTDESLKVTNKESASFKINPDVDAFKKAIAYKTYVSAFKTDRATKESRTFDLTIFSNYKEEWKLKNCEPHRPSSHHAPASAGSARVYHDHGKTVTMSNNSKLSTKDAKITMKKKRKSAMRRM